VNGRLPPLALDLRPWLDAGAGADIVAVAFQECVPLSASNVVMGEFPELMKAHTTLALEYCHAHRSASFTLM